MPKLWKRIDYVNFGVEALTMYQYTIVAGDIKPVACDTKHHVGIYIFVGGRVGTRFGKFIVNRTTCTNQPVLRQ